MSDLRPILVALLLAAPAACHDERDPEHPGVLERGTAGMDVGTPTPEPSTTNEPVVPGVPNAIHGPERVLNPGPIAQASGGTGGTLGTGGTNVGGIGPVGGSAGIVGTGGSIVMR